MQKQLPIVGPIKGAMANTLIARPLSSPVNRSATTPPAFVNGDDPKAPERNLSIRSVWIFWDPVLAARNIVTMPYVITNSFCLPYSSDKGAHSKGPKANPRTYSDIPSVATSESILNSSMTPETPPV